jgi:hypothetical protein
VTRISEAFVGVFNLPVNNFDRPDLDDAGSVMRIEAGCFEIDDTEFEVREKVSQG